MKKMYYIAHIVVLLSLSLSACAPQAPGNNSIQTPVEPQGETPNFTPSHLRHMMMVPKSPSIVHLPNLPHSCLLRTLANSIKGGVSANTDLGIAYLAEDVIWSPCSEKATCLPSIKLRAIPPHQP